MYKVYHFQNILHQLKNLHPFIPDFEIELVSGKTIDSIKQLTESESYNLVKQYLVENEFSNRLELNLIDLGDTSIKLEQELEKQRSTAMRVGATPLMIKKYQTEVSNYIEIMNKLVAIQNDMTLPVPIFNKSRLFTIDQVKDKLRQDKQWFIQVVDFHEFITGHSLEIKEELDPTDFLFSANGNVKVFMSYGKLHRSSSSKKELMVHNMNQLKVFINLYANYFYQDSGQSYNHEISKVISKVNSPNRNYHTFAEIHSDLENTLVKHSKDHKIGVFIDYANISKSIYPLERGMVKIHFNRLLSLLLDEDATQKVMIKYASVFQATYQIQESRDYEQRYMDELKNYFYKEEIELQILSNGTEKAKQVINGEEFDIDDYDLMTKMQKNLHVLDEIILFSGDKHFIEVVKEYKGLNKKVRIIAANQSMSSELRELADDFRAISQFRNCLEYNF